MKSGKSFFQLPFVIISREKYQELIIAENRVNSLIGEKQIIQTNRDQWCGRAMDLEKQLADINLKRNAKGQFERRAK